MLGMAARFPGSIAHIRIIRVISVAGAVFGASSQAFALTKEAAIERCRMTVGRPIVMDCMRGGGGDLEACRAKASPKVRACVMSSMQAANGRANVAVALPTEAAPKLPAGQAVAAGFVAPPRTIADIAAILDSEKPDVAKIQQLKAEAGASPTGNESRAELAQFHFNRANARAQLGLLADTIADANKAIEVGRGAVSANMLGRLIQLAGLQYASAGDPKKAFELFQRQLKEVGTQVGSKGYQFGANRQIAGFLMQMGDLAQAEAYLRRNDALIKEARTSGLPGWRSAYIIWGHSWEADVELGHAMLYEARGQFREAEAAYELGGQHRQAGIKPARGAENAPSESQMLQAVDIALIGQARMKARQGRLAEAEADARRALLSRLKDGGKYNPATPRFITALAGILIEQGRYAEAEKLARASLEIDNTVGVAEDAATHVQVLAQLGGVLNLQRKGREAYEVFAQIDKAIANWEPARRQSFELNPSRIVSLYASKQFDAGIVAAEQLVKKQIARVGETHFDTASARGTLAVGLMLAGRDAEATREFKAAIPVMMAASRENADDDDTTGVAARSQRLQGVAESYFTMLARNAGSGGDVGEETFGLADAIRGRSVQQALAASSARAGASDPVLAELIRKEQDLSKQVNAQLGTLNNVLALSSAERDEKGVQAINASINALRVERNKARRDINQKFPAYADLVSPRPPTVAEIRTTLADDEAMVSFYFGQGGSFVWAVPKSGPVAFAAIKATSGEIESKVRKLREALEPQAAMISDIPEFDLNLGYELYSLLLQPVEGGWKPAKKLIVVTNGALGLLPLSLLPTSAVDAAEESEPLFAAYRNVPWLARSHAVTAVPSAAALRTLRQLPAGKPNRGELVAFGDPYFSTEQQAEAEVPTRVADAGTTGSADNVMRGMPLKRRNSPKLEGVDSADLALLPRLPDTSEELKSIALALQADPSKVLYLGKDASEKSVKTMNLSGFKILAFATHGLVPGELNGLTQPALAMSSPAGDGGSGRWSADDGRNPGPETRCRLGGAVSMQYRCRCWRRRGSRLGSWSRVLLRGDARASGHELVGSLTIRARTRDRSVQASGR